MTSFNQVWTRVKYEVCGIWREDKKNNAMLWEDFPKAQPHLYNFISIITFTKCQFELFLYYNIADKDIVFPVY